MAKRNNDNTISGFIASIMYFFVVLIVLNVLYIYTAERQRTGKEINIPYTVAKQVKQVWSDFKTGWNEVESDSTTTE